MTPPRRIGFIGFDGVTALDFVGPLEVFTNANALSGEGAPLYRTTIIGLTSAPFAADSGLTVLPQEDFAEAREFDTLIVPGGVGLRTEAIRRRVADFLGREAPRTRRLVSVCTGLYGLAATGLLDGRLAATHWRYAADVKRCFPEVRVDARVLFLIDPPFYTSAGITAGVDLALALVEADHGADLALRVARELVVYLKRPGGQVQFSEPLKFQTRATDRFADLAAWLPAHLTEDLGVAALAKRTHMSPRHFSRQFKATFGATVGDHVERLRLETARERLGAPHQTVEGVAYSVGFRSSDVFRRAFERRFGVTPSAYGRYFGVASADTSAARATWPPRDDARPSADG